MKSLFFLLLLSFSLAIFYSCNKAGIGGDATLVVFLKHHDMSIPNLIGYPDTVFVKFNAKELPGTAATDFDTYFIGEEGEDHVHCENLKAGKYYLYGAGYDSVGHYRVTGGAPFTIHHSESKIETDITLQVTE